MKKSFFSFKSPRDKLNLAVAVLLCGFAISLFFINDDAVTVFAQNKTGFARSFYGFVGSLA